MNVEADNVSYTYQMFGCPKEGQEKERMAEKSKKKSLEKKGYLSLLPDPPICYRDFY